MVQGTSRRRWLLALLAAAGAGAVAASRLRARASHRRDEGQPADVSFMLAIHDAMRRDLSRLRDAAAQLDRTAGQAGAPATVLAGWNAFRSQLDFHHAAEDDDLWPVLRPELSDPADLAAVDAMVAEHEHIPSALAAVDDAIRGDAELTPPVEHLSALVLDHLAHEERAVVPLLEQHLSRAGWHAFLMKERGRRRARERPEFLTWVLDDASQDDARAVLGEVPAPGRLVYQRILRPRYDAQHRWQLPTPASAR